MIARGDLAVECGYERLAELQEEILWLCEAAEISDAAMSERAECVMLNKGPGCGGQLAAPDAGSRLLLGALDREVGRDTLRVLLAGEQVSERFGASIEMARWRANACGGQKILQRARRS